MAAQDILVKIKNWRTTAAVALIVSVAGFLIISGVSKNSVYFWTVSEVLAGVPEANDRAIRVSGEVVEGSIKYDQENLLLAFAIKEKDDPEKIINATYNGVIPDVFKGDIEVILEGTYERQSNTLNAAILLAKCPSKYVEENSSK